MKKFFLIVIFLLLISLPYLNTFAQNTSQSDELQKKIADYENKLAEIRKQKNTLATQIQLMDTQIYLTTLKIQETEKKIESTQKEIELLDSKIVNLDANLDSLLKTFIAKVINDYKKRNLSLYSIILEANNFANFFRKIKYIQSTREANKELILKVQQAKANYQEQKKLREEKTTYLENLKVTLNNQKAELNNQKLAKQQILKTTENDEIKYQQLLARAKAEFEAIQNIIIGAGNEVFIKEVKKGDLIATIISGQSCNSSGSHLHFTVLENGVVKNPFSYLKNINYIDESNGDLWAPSGNWDWPISSPAIFTQGFGETWAVRNLPWLRSIYKFHNGIDIYNSSLEVFAVADGKLYRGNYNVGCLLPYTKLIHNDSNIATLYLHTYTKN